jgi:nucleoid-associated protein YgaU
MSNTNNSDRSDNKFANLGNIVANEGKEVENNVENKWENMAEMASEAASSATSEYEVQQGDTLSAIGKRHGVSWQKIFEANKDVINDPDMIQPGWKLKIPGKQS